MGISVGKTCVICAQQLVLRRANYIGKRSDAESGGQMPDLDFQPEMIGRENEFSELKECLIKASRGRGSTVLISGEAGIGKTRLIDELKNVAQSKGFQILSGNGLYESLTPYMPFVEALRSEGLESLFADEAPRVEAAYLVTNTGLLIKEVVRKETELDPDIFASMLVTVGDFVKDSLSMLEGEQIPDTLNRLGYGDHTILIESGLVTNLVTILTGRENEFLINDMRGILSEIGKRYGDVLEQWDGDEESVKDIEKLLQPLVTSGKYDGIYYGKSDPRARRNLLFENVSMGLTRRAQTTPTVLCLEDLHWADASSLALMHYVAKNTRECSLLILGTYRPEDVAAEEGRTHPLIDTMQLMNREDLYEKIELQRLREESMTEFLSSLLGQIDLGDEFENRMYAETEGNPLFIMELMRLLVDEEVISIHLGTWKLAKGLEEIDIPSKIYDVIVRRLNRVEGENKDILDYASVIGEEFPSNILTSAMGLERIRLLESLRTLEQKHGLIHSSNGNYRFDHSKIKEVLYEEIPPELRTEYHSIIAGTIETANKGNIEEVIGDLAFHYSRCKSKEKALHYLTKAAEKAKKEFSNEEAIGFYYEALEFEDDRQKRVEVLEALGNIYYLIGNYDRSIESYEGALELSDEGSKKADIKAKIGMNHEYKGEFTESMRACDEALGLLEGTGCMEEAHALNNVGSVYSFRGEFDKALKYYQRSLELYERIGDEMDTSKVVNNMGVVYQQTGKYEESLEHFKRSLGIFTKAGDLSGAATCLMNIGLLHRIGGEYDKALECQEKSLEMREKTGYLGGISFCLHEIGNIRYCTGAYDRALEYYEESLGLCKKLGNPTGMSFDLCAIAETHLRIGDLPKALDYCKMASDLSNEIGYTENIAASKRIFGMIYREQNDWERSIKEFEECISNLVDVRFEKELADSHYEFGLMWKKKGDTEKAEEQLSKAIEFFGKLRLEKDVEKAQEALSGLTSDLDQVESA